METVSGNKEVVKRDSVVQVIVSKLKALGPLGLVVPGRPSVSQ